MSNPAYAQFETAIGACVIAWTDLGVRAVGWPGSRSAVDRLGARLPGLAPAQPPPVIGAAIESVTALLRGEKPDLSATPLDLDGAPEFDRRVYAIALTIPPGQTLTYGEIAARLGNRLLAREVGQALGRNPVPIIVPCHRVLAAGGRAGGFSAPGGVDTKLRILAIEGVFPGGQPSLFS